MKRSVVLCSLLAACAGSKDTGPDTGDSVPKLEITQPVRGAVSQDGTVTVQGTVIDQEGDMATVTIGGQSVDVAAGESFELTVPIGHGITRIETTVSDKAGQTNKDIRAVMKGDFAMSSDSITDAIGIRLNHSTLDILEAIVEAQLSNADLSTLVTNPVIDENGHCGKKIVNINDISFASASLSITPRAGGLDVTATLNNFLIEGTVFKRTACIVVANNKPFTASATSVQVTGKLDISAQNGISVAIYDTQADMNDFDFDSGWLIDLFTNDNRVEEDLEGTLVETLENDVPATVDNFLASFTQGLNFNLLGKQITVDLGLNEISFASDGGYIGADVGVTMDNGEAYEYFDTPQPLPNGLRAATDNALQVGIKQALINSAIAGWWNEGMLQLNLPTDNIPGISALATDLTFEFYLPPIMNGESGKVSIGDLVVTGLYDGQQIFQVAFFAEAEIGGKVDSQGAFRLNVDNFDMDYSVIDVNTAIISQDILETLLDTFGAQADNLLGDAMAGIAIPEIAGKQVVAPQVQPLEGYLMATAGLQ